MKYLAYNVFMKKVTLGDMHCELKDLGMRISKTTLNNWLHKGMEMLSPVMEQLKESALEKDSIVNCDETWCKVRRYNRYTKKYNQGGDDNLSYLQLSPR